MKRVFTCEQCNKKFKSYSTFGITRAKNKMDKVNNTDDKLAMIYQWVKQMKISVKQFRFLVKEVYTESEDDKFQREIEQAQAEDELKLMEGN